MDIDTTSRLAYSGTPPDSAMPYEWLLWYRLRDIYDKVKQHEMTKADGAAQKRGAVNSFETDKMLHEVHIKLWQRIERDGTAYAKSENHTPEADAFYKAVYGVPAGRNINTHPDGEQNDTGACEPSGRVQETITPP